MSPHWRFVVGQVRAVACFVLFAAGCGGSSAPPPTVAPDAASDVGVSGDGAVGGEDAGGGSEDAAVVGTDAPDILAPSPDVALDGTPPLSDGAAAADVSADAPGSIVPRLAVRGPDLVDPQGAPILLRGWNWGQWGSVQPQDGSDNAAQGANVVRIPLRWWGEWGDASVDSRSDAAPGHVDPAHLALLDGMIKEAGDAHLWVVLFVDSNCGQASMTNDTVAVCGTGSDGAAANFLNDPGSKQKFVELWRFLAARYAAMPFIGMYEILPEPNFTCSGAKCTDWSAAPTFYASIIPVIRAADARTPILVGADSGYDLRRIETAYIPGASGLVYTGDVLDFTAHNPDFLMAATDFRSKHGVPVFIQQVGVKKADADAVSAATTILTQLNADGFGWTWWTYRETKSASGDGFAPYYQAKNGPWSEDVAWLQLITAKFH